MITPEALTLAKATWGGGWNSHEVTESHYSV